MKAFPAMSALVLGGVAGLASISIWTYGPVLALVVVALVLWVYRGRGWQQEAPLAVVGAGLVAAGILVPLVANTDPAVRVDPSTVPAFVLAVFVLAIGILWTVMANRLARVP
ncbi:MAG: hypothetical protein ACRDGL_05340 [Candidatus Limnocylindrales bacterium]